MNPIIIIPAFNPPDTFIHLLKSIRSETSIPIIIIDDGTKSAVHIDQNIIDVILLRNNINRGKGYTLIKGINYALDHGFTHGITLDADSQHDPASIIEFLSINEKISIVCGKRNLKGSMPIHRRLSNLITTKIISLICHTKLFDSQCGYRRYRLKDVHSEIFIEKGFQFESEVLIKLLRKKELTISHIDISTIYADESSTMHNFYDTLKFIRLIIRTLLKY